MAAKGTKKCKDCGNYFDPHYEDVYWAADGSLRCWECHQATEMYAHTMKVYSPSDELDYCDCRTVRFDEDFIYYDTDDEDDEPFPYPVTGVEYHRTDAWRGYYQPRFADGWVDIAHGWATGMPDETVSRKVQFNDLVEALTLGYIVPPCELVFVFCQTSNVLSVGVDAVVREEDVPALQAWLETAGCDIEEALS